jgi:putative flippase GtrA
MPHAPMKRQPPSSPDSGVRQLFRFGMIGIVSNCLGYLAYLALAGTGVPPLAAMTLVFALSVAIGYCGNGRWTFGRHGLGADALRRYCLAYAAGYAVNLLGLWFFHQKMAYRHDYVQAAMIPVVALLLFILQRHWVFPPPRPAD